MQTFLLDVAITETDTDIKNKCASHFNKIYGEDRVEECLERLDELVHTYRFEKQKSKTVDELWTERDQILITYADMVSGNRNGQKSPLAKQHEFLAEYLYKQFSTVHILPFFPSSSDDGFSVMDYRKVDEEFGDWDDIVKLAADFRLMADLVINHVSRHSEWFSNYLQEKKPYDDYFIDVDPDLDLSAVTRPRSSPMLTPVEMKNGKKKLVWTTFSDDQKDVNFKNPAVLFEYLEIFFLYVTKGIKVIRLDAVAFLWKEIGTSCIHLPETHEIVKLFRTLVDYYMPDVTLITETNVPHKENIRYFGDGDEAHMVYQFSLPPLLLHALLAGDSSHLTEWLKSLEPLPDGCTYFNFTSSHDGIGMRPLEGLIPDEEFMALVDGIKEKGGYVSYKQNPDKSMSPYELNITYFDAFESNNGHAGLQEKQYLCSQAIMLSLQGVPGIYFHNLTGTRGNIEGVKMTGRYRTINRKKWDYDELIRELNNDESMTKSIFNKYRQMLDVRHENPAFHPFGDQKVYDGGEKFFIIERQSPDKSERVLVICNLTLKAHTIDLTDFGLPVEKDREYINLLTGKPAVDDATMNLQPFDVNWIKL